MFGLSVWEIAGLVLILFNELVLLLSPCSFYCIPKRKKADPRKTDEVKRLAAVIFAHNEESVIGEILSRLNIQTRPAETVFVIADDCSDGTARIAADLGAEVWEKGPTQCGGKAGAFRFFLEKVRKEDFDGFVFFDADTMPEPDFLEHIAADLKKSEMVIGNHTFGSRPQTWAEAGNALRAHVMWHQYYLPRYRHGSHSLVLGMGYALRRSFLERVNWTPRTLTEDLAFSLDAALAEADFALCSKAQYQDKQPENWLVSWHRMRRWMTGDLQCLRLYFSPLAKRALHGDMAMADLLFFLFSVPLFILKAAGLICLLAACFTGCWKGLAFVLGLDLLMVCASVWTAGRRPVLRRFSIPAFFCLLLQLPWIALSALIVPPKCWVPGRMAPYSYRKNDEVQDAG